MDLTLFLFLTSKDKTVRRIEFQEVVAIKWVNHSLITRRVYNLAFIFGTEGEHVNSIIVESDKVLIRVKKNTRDWRFPELEGLVAEQNCLSVALHVHDHDVVCVDIDRLVTYAYLPVAMFFIP